MEAPASAEAETAVLDGLGEGSWGCGRDLGWAEESLSLRPEVEVVWVRWGGEVRVVERSRSCPGIPSAQQLDTQGSGYSVGPITHLHPPRRYPPPS